MRRLKTIQPNGLYEIIMNNGETRFKCVGIKRANRFDSDAIVFCFNTQKQININPKNDDVLIYKYTPIESKSVSDIDISDYDIVKIKGHKVPYQCYSTYAGTRLIPMNNSRYTIPFASFGDMKRFVAKLDGSVISYDKYKEYLSKKSKLRKYVLGLMSDKQIFYTTFKNVRIQNYPKLSLEKGQLKLSCRSEYRKYEKIPRYYRNSYYVYLEPNGILLFHEKKKLEYYKKPASFSKDNYVGIEIECYTKTTREELKNVLAMHKLGGVCEVASDGSLHATSGYQSHEVRVLTTESTYKEVINKVCNAIKQCEGIVNDCCGLHVHLDMRNKNPVRAYWNLYDSRDILYMTIPEKRKTNTFCSFEGISSSFKKQSRNSKHYDAISLESLNRHKTIEVRCHEGTVDADAMSNWIDLLLNIVNKPKQYFTDCESIDDFRAKLPESIDYINSRLEVNNIGNNSIDDVRNLLDESNDAFYEQNLVYSQAASSDCPF